MDTDINDHLSSCEKCQKTKLDKRATANFISPLPLCNAPNQKVQIDLFCPLKSSGSGKKYIFCMTNAFTKYVELVALCDNEVQTVATALFENGFADTDCHYRLCQMVARNFATKL